MSPGLVWLQSGAAGARKVRLISSQPAWAIQSCLLAARSLPLNCQVECVGVGVGVGVCVCVKPGKNPVRSAALREGDYIMLHTGPIVVRRSPDKKRKTISISIISLTFTFASKHISYLIPGN